MGTIWYDEDSSNDFVPYDLSGVDYVDAPDLIQHTIDQGPMSNMVISLSNGKFDYGNSTLYSFAE
jgi:hypothetical protein